MIPAAEARAKVGGEIYLEEDLQGSAFSNGDIREAGLDARVTYLSERVSELNLKLEAALGRIAHLEQDMIELRERQQSAPATPAAAPQASAATSRAASTETAPASGANTASTIQDVLRKVYSGDAEGAQKLLLSLTKEEMQRNTSVVALVAATLCIQRGDMSAGLQALQRARQFTDDARLLRVIDLVEAQIGLQPS